METTPTPTRDPAAARAPERAARRRRSRGQSLAEFALTFPMALLMVLFGLDFGRVFLGWVALNNAARQAANYAAMNPTAWTSPYDSSAQGTYVSLVTTEASKINCTLGTINDPTFPSGTSIGAPAQVQLTCSFGLITPLIGLLTGNPIPMSASSAFPIRAGLIDGVPVPSASPSPSPAATSSSPAPSGSPGASAGASASPSAGPTAAPTAAPTASSDAECKVVSLINVLSNKAQSAWRDAGFSGTVIFSPLVPPHYRIAWQSLTVGAEVSCSSNITVRASAP